MKVLKERPVHDFPIDDTISCVDHHKLRDFSEDAKYKIKLFLKILQRNVR
jgi:hypothetical protein